MTNLFECIADANSVAIVGHVRPDGDCVGSCMGMYNYISKLYQGKTVDVFLEAIPDVFEYIANVDKIITTCDKDMCYDLFISLDCGDELRFGDAKKYFDTAKLTINIDHHISNTSFADINIVFPEASSTCEVVFSLLDERMIDKDIAEALYTGIIHDTGVFKYSNTSLKTMDTAGKLMEHGIAFSKIIDESFYQRTFLQTQIMGKCLSESFLILDGKCIVSAMTKEMMDYYGATPKDVDGVIDQLRVTKGVEVAIFMYGIEEKLYKISLRANEKVNVSEVATAFGGGGHVKASGCTIAGTIEDIVEQLTKHIAAQL